MLVYGSSPSLRSGGSLLKRRLCHSISKLSSSLRLVAVSCLHPGSLLERRYQLGLHPEKWWLFCCIDRMAACLFH